MLYYSARFYYSFVLIDTTAAVTDATSALRSENFQGSVELLRRPASDILDEVPNHFKRTVIPRTRSLDLRFISAKRARANHSTLEKVLEA